MKEYREDKPRCHFHPEEVIVGVCPLCLNEKLLILASNQTKRSTHTFITTLPNIFALGNSLLNRFEFRHRRSDRDRDDDDNDASTSQEDSFISMKFENNGVASWEKGKVSIWDHSLSKEANKGPTTVVEHVKPRASLRWRKRIGHLFQVIRWKRSNKGKVCHVGSKLEGVKVRNGWIRTLTKRRATE